MLWSVVITVGVSFSHCLFFTFIFPKVAKVDETKRCVYVHLFTDKNFHDPARSLNHQMAQSELFKQQPDVFLTSHRFLLLL